MVNSEAWQRSPEVEAVNLVARTWDIGIRNQYAAADEVSADLGRIYEVVPVQHPPQEKVNKAAMVDASRMIDAIKDPRLYQALRHETGVYVGYSHQALIQVRDRFQMGAERGDRVMRGHSSDLRKVKQPFVVQARQSTRRNAVQAGAQRVHFYRRHPEY